MRLLSNLLTKFIQKGTLRVFDSGGTLHSFGDKAPGPTVTLRLHDRALEMKLAINPDRRAQLVHVLCMTFDEALSAGREGEIDPVRGAAAMDRYVRKTGFAPSIF